MSLTILFFFTFYTVLSWTVSPQNSYVEALTPEPKNVTIFGEGAFKMLTKLKGNC